MTKPKITPCLWYDGNAEEAARFYATVLPDVTIDNIVKAPSDNPGGGKEGQVLIVEFTIAGQKFTGLNGGPFFKFNEAVSFQIDVIDQAEYDRLTEALSAVPEAEQCGWIKDRFGLSWQIVPYVMNPLLADPDPAVAQRVFAAMMSMKRLNIAELERAAAG